VVGSVVKLRSTLFHVRLLNRKPSSIIFLAELHKRARIKKMNRELKQCISELQWSLQEGRWLQLFSKRTWRRLLGSRIYVSR
jgi:hypothetical protein